MLCCMACDPVASSWILGLSLEVAVLSGAHEVEQQPARIGQNRCPEDVHLEAEYLLSIRSDEQVAEGIVAGYCSDA